VLGERLVAAARRVARVYARPACELTGGFDSRGIVAAFLTAGVDFGTVVTGPADRPDVIVSRGLSQAIGKVHLAYDPAPHLAFDDVRRALRLADGEHDGVEYRRVHAVHRRLSERPERFDVAIQGTFGDLGRGLWWAVLEPDVGARLPLDTRKAARRRYVIDPDSPELFPPGARVDMVEHVAGVMERANAEIRSWRNTAQMDNVFLTLRLQRWHGRIASSTDQIWPILSPYMFRSVLETILRVPWTMRRDGTFARRFLARLQPRVAAYPMHDGYPAFPMTWRAWLRHAPLLAAQPRGTWRTAAGLAARGGQTDPSIESAEAAHRQLRNDPEVRALLAPEAMRLRDLVETSRLRAFLEAADRPGFRAHKVWNRLLSLECALRL
jgi:hypothetical protein